MTRAALAVLLLCASCRGPDAVDATPSAPLEVTPALETLAPAALPPDLRLAVLPYMVPSSRHPDLANFRILNGSDDAERDHVLATAGVRSLYQQTKFAFLSALLKQAEVREVEMKVALDSLLVQGDDLYNADSTPKFGRFEGYDAVLLLYFDCALVDFRGGSRPRGIEVDFCYKVVSLETNTLLAARAGQLLATAGD